jgi:NTP pyrophosphatase (non-canonical NTP hydrolase)
MSETQQSIARWADETFGPMAPPWRILTRANKEMAELLHAATAPTSPTYAADLLDKAADVVIVLFRFAHEMGFDLVATAARLSPVAGPAFLLCSDAHSCLARAIRTVGYRSPMETAEAEVFAHMAALCRLYGTTLAAEVDRKMAINRGRAWTLDATGQHVRDRIGDRSAAHA